MHERPKIRPMWSPCQFGVLFYASSGSSILLASDALYFKNEVAESFISLTTTLYPGRIRSHDSCAPQLRRFH
jgi:hypothetical protein